MVFFPSCISRVGASTKRRVILRLSVGEVPPSWPPSGAVPHSRPEEALRGAARRRGGPQNRGCGSCRCPVDPCSMRRMVVRHGAMQGRCHRPLFGHGPQQAHQGTGDGHHHWGGVFAAGDACAGPCTAPALGLPAEVLEGLGWLFESALARPADCRRKARRPSAFDQGATRMGVAGLRDGALAAALARGIGRGDQAKNFMRALGVSQRVRSPRSATGVPATVHGTPRRACRASPPGGTRHAVPCAWRACARRGRRSGCAVTARPDSWPTMGCAEGTDDFRAPPQRGWGPGGPARGLAGMPEQEGGAPPRGGRAIAEGLCTGPAAVRVDAGPGGCGNAGGGHHPARSALCGARPGAPVATGAGGRETAPMCGPARAWGGGGARWHPGGCQWCPGRCPPRRALGRQTPRRSSLCEPPCRCSVCETATWVTAERVGEMCPHQVPLISRKFTRLASGGNFPLSEVIMSRHPSRRWLHQRAEGVIYLCHTSACKHGQGRHETAGKRAG